MRSRTNTIAKSALLFSFMLFLFASCARQNGLGMLKEAPKSMVALNNAQPIASQSFSAQATSLKAMATNMKVEDEPQYKPFKISKKMAKKHAALAFEVVKNGKHFAINLLPGNKAVTSVMTATSWAKTHAPMIGGLIALASLIVLILLIIILVRMV